MRLLFLKQKQIKNIKKHFLKGFCFKTHKRAFWGQQFFFVALALKTIEATNVVLVKIFENAKKKLITAKNGQNGIFDGL